MAWLSTLITKHYLNTVEFDYYFYDDDIPEDERQFGYPDEDIICASPKMYSGKRIEDVIHPKYCGKATEEEERREMKERQRGDRNRLKITIVREREVLSRESGRLKEV